MTLHHIIFLAIGFVILVSSIMVVTSPRLVHAGLWLIAALGGTAALFLTLENGFLAIVQVAVYIDAIAILIIIVVMLTRAVMRETDPQINRLWLSAAVGSVLLFAGLMAIISRIPGAEAPVLIDPEAGLEVLGRALVDVDAFIIPFEIASVLLVAALIGAIFVALPPIRGRSEE